MEVMTILSELVTAEFKLIEADPVASVMAFSSPTLNIPSPFLSTNPRAPSNGALIAVMLRGAMLSDDPPKLQADKTEAKVMKDAFLAFLAEISFFN